jgi:hypothetical protein
LMMHMRSEVLVSERKTRWVQEILEKQS